MHVVFTPLPPRMCNVFAVLILEEKIIKSQTHVNDEDTSSTTGTAESPTIMNGDTSLTIGTGEHVQIMLK